MKTHCNVHTISIVCLLFIPLLITGCAMTTSGGLYKKDVALDSQKLFQSKCSKCHDLPIIEAYPYTPDEWANIVDAMVETEEAGQYISAEEAKKIKGYLRKHLDPNNTK